MFSAIEISMLINTITVAALAIIVVVNTLRILDTVRYLQDHVMVCNRRLKELRSSVERARISTSKGKEEGDTKKA